MDIHTTAVDGSRHQVKAEKFEIPGSIEFFAVHHTSMADWEAGYKNFSASHVGTGLRIAHGDTEEECISEARRIWASKRPEEISAAIERAMSLKNKQENQA